MTAIWHWVLQVTGSTPISGSTWSNFWGGFGSDISEFSVFGVLLKLHAHHRRHCPQCNSGTS